VLFIETGSAASCWYIELTCIPCVYLVWGAVGARRRKDISTSVADELAERTAEIEREAERREPTALLLPYCCLLPYCRLLYCCLPLRTAVLLYCYLPLLLSAVLLSAAVLPSAVYRCCCTAVYRCCCTAVCCRSVTSAAELIRRHHVATCRALRRSPPRYLKRYPIRA